MQRPRGNPIADANAYYNYQQYKKASEQTDNIMPSISLPAKPSKAAEERPALFTLPDNEPSDYSSISPASKKPLTEDSPGEISKAKKPATPTKAAKIRNKIEETGLNASSKHQAPKSSFLENFKDPVYHVVGYSTKEVKAHFQKAWTNDKSKLTKEMAAMKMGGRCLGFAASVVINITARAAGFTFALTSGIGMALFQFVRHPIETFKDPHKAMEKILGAGAVGGVIAGGAIGGFGELLIRASLSIDTSVPIELDGFSFDEGGKVNYKYQENPFEKAAQDNLGPTILGTMLAAGITCIYPAMWQLPFVKPKKT